MADCRQDPGSPGQAIVIGGYFELEVPRPLPCDRAVAFQSARAAIASALVQAGVKRAWLPTFLCNTVADEIRRVGVEIARYELQSDWVPEPGLTLHVDEAALIVNYFGVCKAQVDQALKQLLPSRCIVDNSQAFGEPVSDCLATVYSCRKFFGVPDGGLITDREIVEPPDFDEHSISRCKHLLLRLDREPEDGLAAYRHAQKNLIGAPHWRMSRSPRRLLASAGHQVAYARRRDNFRPIHGVFGAFNFSSFRFNKHVPTSPFTYPLLLNKSAAGLSPTLIDRRVPPFTGRVRWRDPVVSGTDRAGQEIVQLS